MEFNLIQVTMEWVINRRIPRWRQLINLRTNMLHLLRNLKIATT